ncbi:MAG: hypothetical protein QNJ34_27400, partial [Xenococcaceae cyanobacterium MO_188.B29]|nr:hypothetical protein [Xenococcaceae cyanobacterium MO_188.B29]
MWEVWEETTFKRLLAEVRGKGKGEGSKVIFTFLFPLTFNLFPNKTEVYRTYARVLRLISPLFALSLVFPLSVSTDNLLNRT